MSKSENLYAQAQKVIPGGVNSPVRAFTGVGGVPRCLLSAPTAPISTMQTAKPILTMSALGGQ